MCWPLLIAQNSEVDGTVHKVQSKVCANNYEALYLQTVVNGWQDVAIKVGGEKALGQLLVKVTQQLTIKFTP